MSHRLFYCDQYAIPLPSGHKFPMEKYQMVRDHLAQDGRFEFVAAPLATEAQIRLAHDSSYLKAFLTGTLTPAAVRRIGFPWSDALVRRTLASAGGTLCATREALITGWGGNLAGDTHHAFRSEGSGFCVFNDLAIAVEWSRIEHGIRRAAIIDLDVHQGDGTAKIFAEDPDVFTVSMHSRENFPFRKQRSKVDVELPSGIGDDAYLSELDLVLPRVLAFEPQIVFYQGGVDVLASDTLGKLSLTIAGVQERDRRVMIAVQSQGLPFVVTLGGGYSRPIEQTALAHANTYRMAAETFRSGT